MAVASQIIFINYVLIFVYCVVVPVINLSFIKQKYVLHFIKINNK